MTDYAGLKIDLALPKYAGMTDAQIAAALEVANIATAGSSQVTADQFVMLFTPTETAAIQASTDPIVKQFLLEVTTRSGPFDLSDAPVQEGLAYISGQTSAPNPVMASPILTTDRAAAIGTVPAGPTISRAQQLGFGPNNDMVQEIAAARKWS